MGCSEVVAKAVYISGHKVPSDRACLLKHQITHIVNMAADVCDNSFPGEFNYLTYYLKDANYEDLSPIFYRTLEWMQNAVETGGRVLVHCHQGVSRSATIVLAYLMWRFKLQFDAAFKNLQKIRPICNPNTGFTCQLLTLGKKLSRAGATSPGRAPCMPAANSANRPVLFRVTPHHAKEPFLMLAPVDSASRPLLDPRFGWVVQGASELLLWVGSQVPDKRSVEKAARQHAQWLDVFEGVQMALEMAEAPRLWQALNFWWLETAEPPRDCRAEMEGLIGVRESFDGEFNILQRCAAASSSECEQGAEFSYV